MDKVLIFVRNAARPLGKPRVRLYQHYFSAEAALKQGLFRSYIIHALGICCSLPTLTKIPRKCCAVTKQKELEAQPREKTRAARSWTACLRGDQGKSCVNGGRCDTSTHACTQHARTTHTKADTKHKTVQTTNTKWPR